MSPRGVYCIINLVTLAPSIPLVYHQRLMSSVVYHKPLTLLMSLSKFSWKRKTSGEDIWNINWESAPYFYVSEEENHIRNVKWKGLLFRCHFIQNITINRRSVWTKPNSQATVCLMCSPVCQFLCAARVLFIKIESVSYQFFDYKTQQ